MLDAAVEMVGRAGATGFSVDCLDRAAPIAEARWYASAHYRGIRVTEANHPGPAEAANALALRLLHGAQCQGCGKFSAAHDGDVPLPDTLIDGTKVDPKEAARRGLCRWERVGKHWIRGCGPDVPENSTREKLARAMAAAYCPTQPIRQAREGYYDEYLSQLPFPLLTLVSDLEANGFRALAQRVRDGDFDATKEESDAWAISDEGRQAFNDLLAPAAAQTRTDGRPAWRAKRGRSKDRKRK